jgi:hypothetical protein
MSGREWGHLPGSERSFPPTATEASSAWLTVAPDLQEMKRRSGGGRQSIRIELSMMPLFIPVPQASVGRSARAFKIPIAGCSAGIIDASGDDHRRVTSSEMTPPGVASFLPGGVKPRFENVSDNRRWC